jgi:hypothetical protein
MRSLFITFLSIWLMAGAIPRPPQVIEVYPCEDSTQTYMQYVGARLNFRLGEKADYSSLRLFIDGVDVTNQSRIGGTRDVPPSRWGIGYTSNLSKPGKHHAEIRFQSKNGEIKSYSWSFLVKR